MVLGLELENLSSLKVLDKVLVIIGFEMYRGIVKEVQYKKTAIDFLECYIIILDRDYNYEKGSSNIYVTNKKDLTNVHRLKAF